MMTSICLSTKFGVSPTKFAEVYKQISEYLALLLLQHVLDCYKTLENRHRKALQGSQPHQQLQLVLRAEDKTYRTLEFASAVAHETTYFKYVNLFVAHKRT